MIMRRCNTRVMSFPIADAKLSLSLSNKLEQFHESHLSSDHLSNVLDSSIAAQKTAMRLVMDAFNSSTGNKSDRKLINGYIESSAVLLDSCNSVLLKLETARSFIGSIQIGLHYLDNEHEPSTAALRRAEAALQADGHFIRNVRCSSMEKSMSMMRALGKKVSEEMPYLSLIESWEMTIVAIQIVNSAISYRSQADPRGGALFIDISNKMKGFSKKAGESGSLKELSDVGFAIQTMLKLVSSWQKDGDARLKRLSLKKAAMELRYRKERLENALLMLEDKIKDVYKNLSFLRIAMIELLSSSQMEDALEIVNVSYGEESSLDSNPAIFLKGIAWVKVKSKAF